MSSSKKTGAQAGSTLLPIGALLPGQQRCVPLLSTGTDTSMSVACRREGWHRCLRVFLADHGENLTSSSCSALRWRAGSLYDCAGNDVDRVVVEALADVFEAAVRHADPARVPPEQGADGGGGGWGERERERENTHKGKLFLGSPRNS